MTTTAPSLMYELPVTAKPLSEQQLSDELFAAETRFCERVGQEPTKLWVAPGELLEVDGLRVEVDPRLSSRAWLLGAEGPAR